MAEPVRHLIFHGRLFRVLGACAWLLACLVATPASADVPAEPKGPVFTVLSTGGQLPENLHYLETPDKGVPLQISLSRRTDPLPAKPGQTLVFGVPRPNPAPDQSAFVPVCSVAWPAGGTQRALVLLATDGEQRVLGIAIDDDTDVFPLGTLRVVNLVNRPLAARWGDTTWEVPPGPGVGRPYPISNDGTSIRRFKVMLGTLRPDGQGTTLIYAGRAEARRGARTLVIVREVKETDINELGEVVDAGFSYTTRWVIDSPPPRDAQN